ncbi:MAG TPA: SDR family NAD(P)-dependent oxidoreductase [Spongiibacteraceae bacterium]|nr:SDR family NAD(P)-dependent oxidoreductase [Spongiibacteraceae bacterium]
MREFAGKTAVVTGGASGVGRALCDVFAAQGMNVVVSDINQAALDSYVDELCGRGCKAIGVVTDVTKQDSVNNLADRAFATFGNVHILCNNAGISLKEREQRVWTEPDNDWQWVYAVHVTGVVNGLRAFIPRMIENGEEGHVVNTSSGNGGLTSLNSSPVYASSKAAVTSLTEVLHYHFLMDNLKLKASLLFPGPHLVNTNLLNSARERPDEFTSTDSVIPDVVDMEQLAKVVGKIQLTQPSEVAAYTLEGIRNDKFWIMADSESQDARVKERCESILKRSNPTVPVF